MNPTNLNSLKTQKNVKTIRPESGNIDIIKKQILDNVFKEINPPPYNQNNKALAKIESLKETLASKTFNQINNSELKTQKRKLKGLEILALRNAIEKHATKKGNSDIKYKLAKLGLLNALSKF
jgi:hypothetical protein